MSEHLTFYKFQRRNEDRCVEVFHPINAWSIPLWTLAACGELGELANLVKKIHRGDFTYIESRQDIADEIGDVIAYLSLLASRCGLDLESCVKEKFNRVSQRYNASTRLE